MSIPDLAAETLGEKSGGNTPVIVRAEDVLTRVEPYSIANPPMDPDNPQRYESFSHPGDVVQKTLDRETRRVHVDSRNTLEHRFQLAESLGPWAVRDLEQTVAMGERSRGLRVGNVNPTANGGGVQYWLMNRVPLSNEIGIDDRWLLMPVNPLAVRETKNWHNDMQGVSPEPMTRERFLAGLATYDSWIGDEAFPALAPELSDVDLVYLHDPQPIGLYDYLPPDVLTIWQSHIENRRELIATEGSIQSAIWENIWKNRAERAKLHLFHPVDSFVPYGVPSDTLGFHPAPFEPGDDLNRSDITDQERRDKRQFWDDLLKESYLRPNNPPKGLPPHVDWDSLDYDQQPIDWDKGYMAVIARFDAAKNLVSVDGQASILEHYARYREMMTNAGEADKIKPLVLVGNGSIDDPDGEVMQALVMHDRQTRYQAFKDDIKVVRAPHDDLAMNVLMFEADFGMQPSRREGFENRVSEWTWHGKPVIVANRGGMPLQVVHGRSGFIEDAHDSEAWAARMAALSTDDDLYAQMCADARILGPTYNYREFSTVAAGLRSYRHFNRVIQGQRQVDHRWRIQDILGNRAA